MSKDQRQDELHFLIQRYGLKPKQMADICGVNLGTVYAWTTFNMARVIPMKHLQSLKNAICQN